MEQLDKEPKHEDQLFVLGGDDHDDDGKVEDSDGEGLPEANATFLTDLNLLIVALSLCSIYNEECVVEKQTGIYEDEEATKGQACMPRLHARKRETNHVKFMRRQIQRTQTTPKDFR
ncbi:hypothetical protein CCACVL1_21844 [Corchorus capsularis]|uniref:Uncharacterized protein n=1 Tax=Corchorus capsularis TaxID=210143 RepID=A0A1R3H268_COCAP|nr:hypothetical protein CCACVL1_21844 [Corchorus capsularis]